MARVFEPYPLLMDPHIAARPWGGRKLATVLNKKLPAGEGPFGEAWEFSDHPDGRSRIANGAWQGETFGDLLRLHPREVCGSEIAPLRYPLLVKFIDAAEDLSVQVHPDDASAPAGDRGKTECWYVMDCGADAEIVYGLRPGVDAAQLRRAAETGAIESCLRREKIRAGDFVYVPAGTVHAILGGTLICEIQQSSNTTYRLWDWNRMPARELHVEESCRAAQYDAARRPEIRHAPHGTPGRLWQLVSNDYFIVDALAMEAASELRMQWPNPHGLIVSVVEGAGALRSEKDGLETLARGQTWFLPAGMRRQELRAGSGGLKLLIARSRELQD